MILVRDVFRIKFGMAKQAIEVWKEGIDMMVSGGMPRQNVRLLTDLVSNYYTLILETTYPSLTEMEKAFSEMNEEAFHAWYPKLVPLCEGGHREMFNIVA